MMKIKYVNSVVPHREEKVEEEEGVLDTLDAGLHVALVTPLATQHYSM